MEVKEIVFRNANGVPMTTSHLVAETFGKEHNKVVRDIEKLECSPDFQSANFGVSFKIRELPNGGSKEERFYNITKDGFTILAMGYTGKKAMEFKEKYIAAFNAMEQQIKQGAIKGEQLISACMQSVQVISQNLLLLSQQVETVMKVNTQMLDRLASLESQVRGEAKSEVVTPPVSGFRAPRVKTKARKAYDPRKLREEHPECKSGREVLKWINTKGVRIKNFEFYAFLRDNHLTSRDDETYNMPTEVAVNSGWMIAAQSGTSQLIDGRHYYTPYFTPAGMKYILSAIQSVKNYSEIPLFAQKS